MDIFVNMCVCVTLKMCVSASIFFVCMYECECCVKVSENNVDTIIFFFVLFFCLLTKMCEPT